MSASMSSTRWVAWASATARLLATSVLPSPGPALVTTSTFAPSAADEKSTLVRIARNASADERIVEILPEQRRHEAEERQPEMRLDLVGRLDPVIEVLEEERQADRQREAADKCEQQVGRRAGARRAPRHLGRVDDADVARLELARNSRLLGALHQAVENLSVAEGVALQRAVVDALAIERQRVVLLLLERVDQALLLRLSGFVLVVGRLDDLGDFALNLRFGGLDPQADLDHVGVTRPELFRELRLLPLQLRQLALLLLDEGVRQDRRERVERGPVLLKRAHLLVERFLLDPLGLGAREDRKS